MRTEKGAVPAIFENPKAKKKTETKGVAVSRPHSLANGRRFVEPKPDPVDPLCHLAGQKRTRRKTTHGSSNGFPVVPDLVSLGRQPIGKFHFHSVHNEQ